MPRARRGADLIERHIIAISVHAHRFEHPGLARPVRSPENSRFSVSRAPSIRRVRSCFRKSDRLLA